MTREDIIRWARAAKLGAALCHNSIDGDRIFIEGADWHDEVERFAALVAAAERERMTVNSIHTCHAECDRPGCVRVREAVKAEREACATLLERQVNLEGIVDDRALTAYTVNLLRVCAAAIRARGET